MFFSSLLCKYEEDMQTILLGDIFPIKFEESKGVVLAEILELDEAVLSESFHHGLKSIQNAKKIPFRFVRMCEQEVVYLVQSVITILVLGSNTAFGSCSSPKPLFCLESNIKLSHPSSLSSWMRSCPTMVKSAGLPKTTTSLCSSMIVITL